MYRIRDLQFNLRYFGEGEGIKFNTKKQILNQLASYHDIDYSGVKDNDEPYKNIYEFLKKFDYLKPNIREKAKLNWILEYGQWRIEKI